MDGVLWIERVCPIHEIEEQYTYIIYSGMFKPSESLNKIHQVRVFCFYMLAYLDPGIPPDQRRDDYLHALVVIE